MPDVRLCVKYIITISNKQLAVGHPQEPTRKTKTQTRKPSKTSRSKARRGRRDHGERSTVFPQVKGKVIRDLFFSHEGAENLLAIDFTDRSALNFEIDPEPLVLPLDVRAYYRGDRPGAVKKWERLAKSR